MPKSMVRILIIGNILSLCAALIFLFLFVKGQKTPEFTEIDVQRINIMGTHGKPVMVLSNRSLIPGPSMNGKDYPRALAGGREYLSGIIFFNDEGDEVGGLLFNGIRKKTGYSSVGHFSLDQWKQNQVVAIQYNDNGKSRRAGLRVWDRPTEIPMDKQLDLGVRIMNSTGTEREALVRQSREARKRGEHGVQRLFVGSRDRTAQVLLYDTGGNVRIRLYVDQEDRAKLEFLDPDGKVVSTYPGRSSG